MAWGEPRQVRISRRTLLLSGVALCAGAASGFESVWADSTVSVDQFLKFSESVTGFEQLERELGGRYLSALLTWEPKISKLVLDPPLLDRMTSEQKDLTNLVIEVWYTGVVPTASGNRVVEFEQALGHRCLPRSTPVTSCR